MASMYIESQIEDAECKTYPFLKKEVIQILEVDESEAQKGCHFAKAHLCTGNDCILRKILKEKKLLLAH